MHRSQLDGRLADGRVASLFLSIALAIAGCGDVQGPAPGSVPSTGEFAGRYAAGSLEFALSTPSGAPSHLTLVATDLVFDPATEILRAQVAIDNRGGSVVPGPEGVVVYDFVPADVTPQNAACGTSGQAGGSCVFDHRGTYGEDGLLSPGEVSAPVEWQLHVPGGQSFAFRARIGRPAAEGTIGGVVFADVDTDGVHDLGEPGFAGVGVRLARGQDVRTTTTDSQGRYAFAVTEAGLYEVALVREQATVPTRPLPLLVTILEQQDGSLSSFLQADIGLQTTAPAPLVVVVGTVFEDLDRDGVQDPGEPGIPGVKIEAETCGEDDHEVQSGANGSYRIEAPACARRVEVRAGPIDGFDRTTQKSVVFLPPHPPSEPLRADFGYALEDPASELEVKGTVFRDLNRNGVRDPGEPGIAGVLVTVQGAGCAGPVRARDRTDQRGRYEIEGSDVACPLPWIVDREPVAGMVGTTPAPVHVDVPPATGRFLVDFGLAPAPPGGI
jgi:hypothetical protein